MREYMNFNKLIAPIAIETLHVISIMVWALSWLYAITQKWGDNNLFLVIVAATIACIFGYFITRLILEGFIIVFKIYEVLNQKL